MNRILTIICCLVVASAIQAQGRGGMGQGMGMKYDTSAEVTLNGKVTEVTKIPHGGRGEGIHLTFQSENESFTIMLGPSFYLDKQTVKIGKDDTITIVGSKIGNMILAREVTKDGQKLVLRTSAGAPLWGRGNGGGGRGKGRR
ncbi:hypothetical protein CH352_02485 [Leptospira hartskeerlii]|uniref:Magnetosome protein MamS/MamX domain-containing protein n=1 Tax=Leptospira hartskeerlii TaxID=2023177 RepID=A0A2M9XDE9_9LEPT|nr:hypothetical protein [Leptospira hartskeerlii]PJZ25680.1 hypothetical protein CH357_08490 [Leptospira hartskeerlii]PJZ35497.1 hypothetical protein CH352_02485 [Leptospira hartskeerlii]